MSIPRLPSVKTVCARHVQEIPFEMLSGNCQGYAKDRQIAINPVAQMPAKTTFHELAHIELGHTAEAVQDAETTPRSLGEAEAELERNLIKERVHMGLSRARKQGKQLGRPRVQVDPRQVAGLRARGLSWNEIARKLGIGRGTAERAFRTLSQKPPSTDASAVLIK